MTAAPGIDLTDEVLDVVDDGRAALVSARRLYARWEQQPWSVADVDLGGDAEAWRRLGPFTRNEMLAALAELEVGEVCVTETLSPIVDHAPSQDDRIYLCTQLADEARHVRFFQTYLRACGLTEEVAERNRTAPGAYGELFEPELRRATAAVRERGGDPVSWYRAVVLYHLVTEGILATTVTRTCREVARRIPLPGLDAGLTNVMRDESRHVGYGVAAVREGVRGGFGDAILDDYLEACRLAARVLVGPQRQNPAPRLRPLLRQRAAQIERGWVVARERMRKQLALVRLDSARVRAERAWDEGCAAALDEYERRWGTPHPVRAAGGATADRPVAVQEGDHRGNQR